MVDIHKVFTPPKKTPYTGLHRCCQDWTPPVTIAEPLQMIVHHCTPKFATADMVSSICNTDIPYPYMCDTAISYPYATRLFPIRTSVTRLFLFRSPVTRMLSTRSSETQISTVLLP